MTIVITRFPMSATDDPLVWRVTEGEWQDGIALSQFLPDPADVKVVALVPPADARCVWNIIPDLEPRQAEGVARLSVSEQSLGVVHTSARYIGERVVLSATIATTAMQEGLARLGVRGINPDIVIPFGLAADPVEDQICSVHFDGMTVLRGATFASPDEQMFRDLLVGDAEVRDVHVDEVREGLLFISEHPPLNLREGMYAKRTARILVTAEQHKWLRHLAVALLAVTMFLVLVTLAKYWSATNAENSRALAAAQKVDSSIQDVMLAEVQLARALQQKGLTQTRFAPLTAGLWKAVQTTQNVSVRELRFGDDAILVAVLAAPDAANINKALISMQQDGFRITATPRQDSSGATLVDLTVRMP